MQLTLCCPLRRLFNLYYNMALLNYSKDKHFFFNYLVKVIVRHVCIETQASGYISVQFD